MEVILGFIGIVLILIAATLLLAFLTKNKIKGGAGFMTTMYGSTYEFYDSEKRKAIETVVEIHANKKMEEQSSDQPKEKAQ